MKLQFGLLKTLLGREGKTVTVVFEFDDVRDAANLENEIFQQFKQGIVEIKFEGKVEDQKSYINDPRRVV